MTPEMVRSCVAHERWAQGVIWDVLSSVPEDARTDARFAKALGKVAHVTAARQAWLVRLGGAESWSGDIFPEPASIDDAAAEDARSLDAWAAFAQTLDEAGLARVIEYTSTEGTEWRNTVAEIFAHVWSHGFLHRGQANTLVAQLGGQARDMDFIFHARDARR